ncbi:MAG: D-sedoheptulose-7-phosphate isomerase [Clostridia bacterium]|jgi:D-sedoheptulose 7-phosphate isomerase
MKEPFVILENLIRRYPILEECEEDIRRAYDALVDCFSKGGKVLICGNGGSAADAEHMVGELMKGFLKKRELSQAMKDRLEQLHPDMGSYMGEKLQGALPAIALTTHTALATAFSNDVDANLIYAQQVLGYGKKGDLLIGFSTSGNAKNVLYAFHMARALDMTTIGFTGKTGGSMKETAEISICVPELATPNIQELHLPVYHALCAMVEDFFFDR